MRTLLGLALFVAACDPASSADGGVALDAPACTSSAECDDGLFCNGDEECVGGGCRAGAAPCASSCDESADSCSDCVDEDGDGHEAVFCGGDDCADNDANRYPGNIEICDASHDEDCDPTTLGADGDGDGFISPTCCNGAVCGDDCQDAAIDVNPGVTERCNGEDDDCDLEIDEETTVTCYADEDNDGYALVGAPSMQGCGECPIDTTSRDPAESADCDDDDPAQHPGADEVCNGIDDDCDEGGGDVLAEDRDGDGHSAANAPCEGGYPKDDCHDRNADVHPGQAAYFTEGFCAPGDCPCNSECWEPQFAVACGAILPGSCTGTRVDPSFDYDCSEGGVVGAGTAVPELPFGSCSCQIGNACWGNGRRPGAPSTCGATLPSNQWLRCGTGVCGDCDTDEPIPTVVPCR